MAQSVAPCPSVLIAASKPGYNGEGCIRADHDNHDLLLRPQSRAATSEQSSQKEKRATLMLIIIAHFNSNLMSAAITIPPSQPRAAVCPTT